MSDRNSMGRVAGSSNPSRVRCGFIFYYIVGILCGGFDTGMGYGWVLDTDGILDTTDYMEGLETEGEEEEEEEGMGVPTLSPNTPGHDGILILSYLPSKICLFQ
jgi:hypothetical protein